MSLIAFWPGWPVRLYDCIKTCARIPSALPRSLRPNRIRSRNIHVYFIYAEPARVRRATRRDENSVGTFGDFFSGTPEQYVLSPRFKCVAFFFLSPPDVV